MRFSFCRVSLLALVLASCNSDHSLNDIKDEPTEPPSPEIKVEALISSPASVPFGCPTSESFKISSVGDDVLEIYDISLLVSATANAGITGLPELPLELSPESSIEITLDFDALGEESAIAMIDVASNDETDPEASASFTLVPEAGVIVIDDFISTQGRNIDLLLVVDNSGSMMVEQSRLIDNAQNIIDGLNMNSADYHIGVITTDSPYFVGDMITNTNLDPELELQLQIAVGTNGSWEEKGIQQSIYATSAGGDAGIGSSFLRDDASLAIVWMSDEDDSSTGTTIDWTAHFWSLKNSPSDVVGWAIVGPDDTSCSTSVPGYDYLDMARILGGGSTSICETNWQPAFEGLAALAGAQSTFDLSDIPFEPSIVVTVDGVLDYDWVYDSGTNSVSFNPGFIPVAGSYIEIEYGISDC